MHVSDLHFLCLHDMSLSFAFLDSASIVLDATCACGTPLTSLLTFFIFIKGAKWKMEMLQFLCV